MVIITLVTNVLRPLRGKIFCQLYKPLECTFASWPEGKSLSETVKKRRAELKTYYSIQQLASGNQNKPPCNELISNESAPFRCAFLFKKKRQTSRDFNTNAQQQVRREWTNTYTSINPLKTIVNNWRLDLQRRCVCKSRVLLSKCGCLDGSLSNPQRLELQQKHVCWTIIRDREVIVA